MKNLPPFRRRIFLPMFLLLLAVSAVSCAAATAALTTGRSAVPATLVAILTSLAVCALASQLFSRMIALESGRLAAAIEEIPNEEQARRRVKQSFFYGEVAAAWDKAALRWERALNQEHLKVMCSKAEMNEVLCNVGKALEERSPFLRGHSERVAEYAVAIAEELGLDNQTIDRVNLAAMVHDLGMIGMGEPLLKKSRLLAVKEFEILRAHPVRGAAILRSIESMHDLIPAVELHHEALDGSGYPYGLKGEEIPLLARILAVADTFDSMTCADPYQPAMEANEAIELLEQMSGTRFDPMVVDAFVRFLERDNEESAEASRSTPVLFVGEKLPPHTRMPMRAL